MKPWVALAGAFIGGVALGYGWAAYSLEAKLRKEYEESSKAFRRAIELGAQKVEEAPAETEDELVVVTGDIQDIQVVAPIHTDPVNNDYHKAVSAMETDVEVFVSGGVNDYGISYLEEEEYLEEDGRLKQQITILMDEHNPIFLMDGDQISDWDERIGDSILVDFYKLVPPGVPPVLYVRNHKTDEDYEVIREIP